MNGVPQVQYVYFSDFQEERINELSKTQNHRMVWVGRDLIDRPVPTLLLWAGHLSLDQVAQSPVQPGLEHFQGQGIHLNLLLQFLIMYQ